MTRGWGRFISADTIVPEPGDLWIEQRPYYKVCPVGDVHGRRGRIDHAAHPQNDPRVGLRKVC
jgi:hypothetical protein